MTPGTEELPTEMGARETIARIIDPIAFLSWQSLYDYCVMTGETVEWAREAADGFHRSSCDEALAKADEILALHLEANSPTSDSKEEGR